VNADLRREFMGALALPSAESRPLPDYLPARMVNEFVYCPRLFYYEWVEGLFADSADTVEGKHLHARVDAGSGALPNPADTAPPEVRHSRSVTLSSELWRVIAKMDLIEVTGGLVFPVDYKRGAPQSGESGLSAWPADRVQVILQGLILREHGYRCEEGAIWYAQTRQRVRVRFDESALEGARRAITSAWETARGSLIPPPLDDSPKCPGCSLNAICLPGETNLLRAAGALGDGRQMGLFSAEGIPRKPPATEGGVRRIVTPRSELRPLYLNTQGLRGGRSGEVLQFKEKEKVVQEVRIGEICQLSLFGNIQLTTKAIQALCEAEVPIAYFSQGGWFYGITNGLNQKNVFLRKAQFALAEQEWFALRLAKALVAGKLRNQRTMLLRNHEEPPAETIRALRASIDQAETATSLGELLGVEGNGARLYFSALSGMIKTSKGDLTFDFDGRNRRPPRDPVNALLSLGYSVLSKDLTIASYAVGFDPFVGFYHQPRYGRPALALDLMEPFRPLVVDSAVLSAINTGMITPGDFVKAGNSVALTAEGRKSFFRAYEARMDSMVTHPLFDYRVSYRRLLEIQTRLLARVLQGEIASYPAFVTR
jgi:CRISPR-associated protein Cas1